MSSSSSQQNYTTDETKNNNNNCWNVGSVVRVRRPHHSKSMGRAMVATIQDHGRVGILWETSIHPQPIIIIQQQQQQEQPNTKKFLIVPNHLSSSHSENDGEDEIILSQDELQPLLPFETIEQQQIMIPNNNNSQKDDAMLFSAVSLWKDRGDQLLRLGDATAASSYYEVALGMTNRISIGGTVVISMQGFPTLAEVDCIIEEDLQMDITVVETGQETTLPLSQVLLAVCESDHQEQFQERLLLNLARCMLQLADLDHSSNRSKYLKAAVLVCSLAITISSFHQKNNNNNDNNECSSSSSPSSLTKNSQTALVLRAKALGNLSKWPNAMMDAKQLIMAGNAQGPKIRDTLERQKKVQQKRDKKLAKEVCKWVQTASQDTVSNNNDEHDDADEAGSPPRDVIHKTGTTGTASATQAQPLSIPTIVSYLLFPLVVAFLIQKAFFE